LAVLECGWNLPQYLRGSDVPLAGKPAGNPIGLRKLTKDFCAIVAFLVFNLIDLR